MLIILISFVLTAYFLIKKLTKEKLSSKQGKGLIFIAFIFLTSATYFAVNIEDLTTVILTKSCDSDILLE
ncbi:hypothetical protein N9O57_00150 [bacterium]|nr:hypothetical protein [bacterium]